MAVTASRTVTVTFVGDINATNAIVAANNASSPGSITIHSLAAGTNTITLPTGGSTPKGALIIPPTGNTQAITLKGVAGDTGVALGKTDPTSLSFDAPPPANFVLNAGGVIDGLRIIWT